MIITCLLLSPADNIPHFFFVRIPYFDKIIHLILFGIWFYSLQYGFVKTKAISLRYSILFNLLVITIYGGVLELIQAWYITGRTGDWYDLLADISGGISAYGIWKITHNM